MTKPATPATAAGRRLDATAWHLVRCNYAKGLTAECTCGLRDLIIAVEGDARLDGWNVNAIREARQAAPLDVDYSEWVRRVAAALHEDCLLEWQAIKVTDPQRQVTMHQFDAHFGRAHDLVRRLNLGGAAAYAAATTDEEGTR